MKSLIRVITFIAVLLFSTSLVNAQTTFQKAYYGITTDILQLPNGDYVSIGGSSGQNPSVYVRMIKSDSNGDTIWTKNISGPNHSSGYALCQSIDGGFLSAGNCDFNTGVNYIYVVKTDSSGNTQWAKAYGSSSGNYSAYSVQATPDSGYIIITDKLLFLKIDSVGNMLWTKSFTNADAGGLMQVTADSGFVAVGTVTIPGFSSNICMIKMNSVGDTLWTRAYGRASSVGSSDGFSVACTADSGYIIAGRTNAFGVGNWDIILIKTDANGTKQWSRTYGGTSVDQPYCVLPTKSGGYMIVGSTSSFGNFIPDIYLINTNSVGDTLWTKAYGASAFEVTYAAHTTNDDGFIITSYSYLFNNGSGYVIKTDSLGNSGSCYQRVSHAYQYVPTLVEWSSGLVTSTPVLNVIPVTNLITNSGGVVTNLCTATGMPSVIDQDLITIYPNPIEDHFTINLDIPLLNSTLEIYTVLGEKIYSEDFNSQQLIVNCKLLPGMYFVQVMNGSNTWKGKIIKQ